MSAFVINGGRRISGSLRVQGAKNSVLPILAATFLVCGKSIIHNCRILSDTNSKIKNNAGIAVEENFSIPFSTPPITIITGTIENNA